MFKVSKEKGSSRSEGSRPAFLFQHKLFYHLALLRLDRIGSVSYRHLCELFGSPEAVFQADRQSHIEAGLSAAACNEIILVNNVVTKGKETVSIDRNIVAEVLQDLRWETQPQHYILHFQDERFPAILKQIHDCPPVLFVIGNPDIINRPQLAIVGSRRPTRTGCSNAQLFGRQLAEQGLVINSGLATGIDSFAHEGALSAGVATTIAVLAHGLDGLYPKRNQQLAARIINSGGALLSEFPVGVKPRPEFFPRRNRIISGMSLGVLVVEAARKSGSLVTAYSALEQNREVFAIPGSIHNPVAQGCHQLLRNGAKLVESCDDIFEELQIVPQQTEASRETVTEMASLNPQEKRIIRFLQDEERSLNDIAQALTAQIDEIAAMLTMLELKGYIQQSAKGYGVSVERKH